MHYPFLTADPCSGLHYRLTDTRLAELSLAPCPSDWAPGRMISALPNPVWTESLADARVETISAVGSALEDLVLATPDLRMPHIDALPDGPVRRHLAALVDLWRRMGDALPEGLGPVRHGLDLPKGRFLGPLAVVEGSLDPSAPALMRALYGRLRDEFGSVPAPPAERLAREGTRLHALQGGMTAPDIEVVRERADALRSWLAGQGYTDLRCEIPMLGHTPQGAEIAGTLDLLALGPGGSLLIDHKSGGEGEGLGRYWPQLSAYARLVGQVLPELPLKGVAVFWLDHGTLELAEWAGQAD